ncbi:MAG: integral membrane protein [Myxococcota bacterium]|jgi:integral membrane protein
MIAFRLTAFLEGISYILLLLIAVPVKYIYEDPSYVKLLGMPHGILFMAYIGFAIYFAAKRKWSAKTLAIVLLGSVLPLGTFYVDHKYLKSTSKS